MGSAAQENSRKLSRREDPMQFVERTIMRKDQAYVLAFRLAQILVWSFVTYSFISEHHVSTFLIIFLLFTMIAEVFQRVSYKDVRKRGMFGALITTLVLIDQLYQILPIPQKLSSFFLFCVCVFQMIRCIRRSYKALKGRWK
ncbi:unnamed protein product, partial [Mesorhabditis belari]|uniref:Uncharacterized protein n=1 Tax=Mesorhabditis belari TaxID=2138241 RepID=A0AAF3EPW8_9BILA